MKRISLLLLAAAGLPLLVHAQSARSPAAVTDANAVVPALQYESVFAARPAGQEAPATPDKIWLKANQDLAGSAGHGAHGMHGMHGMHGSQGAQGAQGTQGSQGAHGAHGAETVPAPAAPSASGAAAPATPKAQPADDPHKGHKMNNMKGH